MGSGAGFPGLVIAIQLADVPGATSIASKATSANAPSCARRRARPARPRSFTPRASKRIDPESLGPVDAVTARAFAPLPLTLELARPWMERGAVGVFPRGESARDQMAALPEATAYAIEPFPSVVDPKAAILRIRRR